MSGFFPLAHKDEYGEQALDEHLFATARRAARFAAKWGGPCAYISGLWHDLGKYQPDFQTYLRISGRRGSVTHSTAGALHLLDRLRRSLNGGAVDRAGAIPKSVQAVMMAIMAHHGKLPDIARFEERLGLINARAASPGVAEYRATLAAQPPPDILDHDISGLLTDREHHPLLARMLLSVLVDADVIDSSGRKAARLKTMAALRAAFERSSAKQAASVARKGMTSINALRAEVLAACLTKAQLPPGFYALDAPTGFGKTFASLGFALEHAAAHGLDRIIYVAPFLTAIEQTAAAFRTAFGVERERGNLKQFTVLEDHSTAERDAERAAGGSDAGISEDVGFVVRDRLRENWEARIIVTSNVNFLESLHAHDRGRCRKLHRLANAVVLMDEPQSIPVSLFAPTVDTLQALVREYGTSVLFITATQPAFGFDKKFPQGIPNIEPILTADLLDRLRTMARSRVTVTLPDWSAPPLTIEEIAARVAGHGEATLCIVNTRGDAAALYRAVLALVPDAEQATVYHLSASMCSDHRAEVLKRVRKALEAGERVRLVSTQVVEAGIDISFPVVLRVMAGLDSLIQSAGRCNRHGEGPPGHFEVVCLADGVPFMFKMVAGITEGLLKAGHDLFDPATAERYYRLVRNAQDKGEDIYEAQERWDLTQVGVEYRLIEPTLSVVVPYGERGERKVEQLLRFARGDVARDKDDGLFEGLSGITVSVHAKAGERLVEAGLALACGDFGLLVAVQDGDTPYDRAALGMPEAEAMLTEGNDAP